MSFKFAIANLVRREIDFLTRYGFEIPPGLDKGELRKSEKDEAEWMQIYARLTALPQPSTPFFASSDRQSVMNALPACARSVRHPIAGDAGDKILGGWLGRAAGCVLGKPLECDLTLPEIKRFCGAAFPLTDYLPFDLASRIVLEKKAELHPLVTRPCSREHVAYAMEDDDLNYTVLNLLLLEQKGARFGTADVGKTWAAYLPADQTWGAETAALVNYLTGMPLERVPIYLNPFRDEIGAQIRADTFGYACPGHPGLASELAFRDAAFSHVADGIYGEMFVAAMVAAAFGGLDMNAVVRSGLDHIPARSRLAELIGQTLVWHETLGDWEAVYERIKAATPQYRAGHTVNNAAYVVNALLASAGDFTKGITVAVMQGHDTDCNGATVGSVLGVNLGAGRLPARWIDPLNDTLETGLRGFTRVRISELARRTVAVSGQIAAVSESEP